MNSIIIGITGGIGSGKSTVAMVLQNLNYPVYNSDDRAKEIYFLPEIKTQVVTLLGAEVYKSNTTLNKKLIADKIFTDKDLLEKLNAIIHPAVKLDFENWMSQHKNYKIVFKESALLFETGLYKNCNKTILVTAPLETRTQRVMQRDNLSKAEVEIKINSQWADAEKIKLADFVINNGDEDLVVPQVLEILNKLN